MDKYHRLLEQLRDHLRTHAVQSWPTTLDEWIRELDSSGSRAPNAHLLRTRRALGGMGSIGDVVISREAGHTVGSDKSSVKAANKRLLRLIEELDAEIGRRLGGGHDA